MCVIFSPLPYLRWPLTLIYIFSAVILHLFFCSCCTTLCVLVLIKFTFLFWNIWKKSKTKNIKKRKKNNSISNLMTRNCCGFWEDSFAMNAKEEYICWDGLPIVNQGSKFYYNKKLVTVCWRASQVLYKKRNLRLNSRLPQLCPACLRCLSQPFQGNPAFVFLSTDWDLPCPISTARFGYVT